MEMVDLYARRRFEESDQPPPPPPPPRDQATVNMSPNPPPPPAAHPPPPPAYSLQEGVRARNGSQHSLFSAFLRQNMYKLVFVGIAVLILGFFGVDIQEHEWTRKLQSQLPLCKIAPEVEGSVANLAAPDAVSKEG